jgi:hypothetical protein
MANENVFLNFEPVIHITLLLGGAFGLLTLVFSFAMKNAGVNIGLITIIISLFVFGILIVVIYFFIYMLLIGGKNYDGAILYTLVIASIPTVFTLFIILYSREFTGIFGNTIGYFISCQSFKTTINSIFELKEGVIDSRYKEHYEENKHVLITLFEYFDDFVNKNKKYAKINDSTSPDNYNFYITSEDSLQKLKEIVYFKHTIGILSWFFISSLFASLISIKILSRI